MTVEPRLRRLAGLLCVLVCGQVCLGIANILLLTPPLIAVSHLALGVGLLSVTLRQLHMVGSAVDARVKLDSPAAFPAALS